MAIKFIGNVPVNEDALVGSLPTNISVPATVAGTGYEVPIGVWNSPNPPVLKSITLIPQAAVATNGTNYMTIALMNRQTGSGTITLASFSTIATSLAAFVATKLTPDFTQAAVKSGETLSLAITKTGTGVVTPPMLVILDWQY